MDQQQSMNYSPESELYSEYLLNRDHDPRSSSVLVSNSLDDYRPKLLIDDEQSLLDEIKLWPTLPLEPLFDSTDLDMNPIVINGGGSNCSKETSGKTIQDDNLQEKDSDQGAINDKDEESDELDDVEDDADDKDEQENNSPNTGNYEVNQTVLTIVPIDSLIANIDESMVTSTTFSIIASFNDQEATLPANCCRKHEAYYRKLLSARGDGPSKVGRLIVNDLYVPMDNQSYLKPSFSHNMLCAFAIICGSDSDFKIEVAEIYQFLGKCFPYFQTAELHWKNSLRHSLAKCNWFAKSEVHRTAKKGFKWTLNYQHFSCLRWEIKKQCIKDLTRLYHCLSGPEAFQHLLAVGLIDLDQPTLSLLRESSATSTSSSSST